MSGDHPPLETFPGRLYAILQDPNSSAKGIGWCEAETGEADGSFIILRPGELKRQVISAIELHWLNMIPVEARGSHQHGRRNPDPLPFPVFLRRGCCPSFLFPTLGS